MAACNDFTRSHLLRASIAAAGNGLPATEPGMPLPAGTGLTRRSVLLRGAGLALTVYGAGRAIAPQAFEAAVAEAAGAQKVLVSIFMDGGNDALSLLAPTGDPRYAVLRPQLALAPSAGFAFEADPRLRWHPSAQGLKELWDDPTVGVALGLALSVYGLGKLRLFEDGIAQAASGPSQPVLVSVFLPGGADSLSVLYPALDPNYRKLRPTLALPADAGPAFAEDTRLHWHPSLQPLATLHGEGKVSVMPAIGYTHPDQSHFTSRHFWEVGATDPAGTTGWLGRYLDRVGSPDVPIQGLSLADTLSPTLATSSVAVAATTNLDGYRFQADGVWGTMQTRMQSTFAALGDLPASDPITAQARQVQANAAGLAADLASVGSIAPPAGASYPAASSAFKTRLQGLAALLATVDGAGNSLPLRCVTLNAQGGYDTHSAQAADLSDNLLSTAGNLRAFWRDLQLRGVADRVVVMLWSEFGRRPAENGSAGTDHGAAGAAFVMGTNVRQGLIGEFPGLAAGTGLDAEDNLRATSDFRGLYCSLLEQWFQTDAAGIIPSAASFARPVLIG